MSLVVGIDPGLQGTGWAVVTPEGELLKCGVLYTPNRMKEDEFEVRALWLGGKVANLVSALPRTDCLPNIACEMPQHFGSVSSEMGWKKGDLQKLTYLVGLFHGMTHEFIGSFTPVLVRDWKGQLPKEVVTQRIMRILSPRVCELKQIETHAWDAVGIALWAVGRFK